MRLTQTLALASQRSPHWRWLSALKSTQLQALARATGIQSSGTKIILSTRIEASLAPYLAPYQRGHGHGCSGPLLEKGRRGEPLRILSIDMGIRNLAFAVLSVPRREDSSSSGSARALSLSTPELLAWRRLAVSEIGELDLGLGSSGLTKKDSSLTSNMKEESPSQTPLQDSPTPKASTSTSKSKEKEKEKDPFSPHLYAKTAYTLITTLLDTYNPTHILIERQRFRSGGASAVQEWTLRVGVLEGMLYAVLETLRGERLLGKGAGGEGEGVVVQGIEPKRVVGFWGDVVGERAGGGGAGRDEGESEGGRKRVSARDVKRGKIDLVGRWLDASLSSSPSSSRRSDPGSDVDGRKIVISPENTIVRDLADAYLRRWRGENGRGKKDASSGETAGRSEIGKLDDLADCLLQGVTWVEWQVMRERIAREGVEVLRLD